VPSSPKLAAPPSAVIERGLMSIQSVKASIRGILPIVLPVAPVNLDDREFLMEYGMDSLMATHLSCLLTELYGLTLSPALVLEYPTVESLASRILQLTAAERHQ
jgi:acyl carrier protein